MGVVFQALMAEVPHHPKCLARLIHSMEDILELVPADRGQLVGVVFHALKAEVFHQPKCLARLIYSWRTFWSWFQFFRFLLA